MHELRVGVVILALGREVGEQARGGALGGRVRERERDALEVEDPLAELAALGGPGDGVDEQPPHRPDAARRDVQPLLDEPCVLPLVPVADHSGPAENGVLGHHAVEPERRVAVRVAVCERRVVDRLDARRVTVHEEQRGPARSVGSGRVGHHDVEVRDVARRDEPLLPAQTEAPGHGFGGRRRFRDGSEPASRSVTA